MMSFCVVPASLPTTSCQSAPCSSACSCARETYSANSHMAVALIVIEVFASASGMPSNSCRMSPMWLIGTPTLPTSPRDSTWSGS